MNFALNYNQITVTLAIAVVFSTVAPAKVSAENVSIITNIDYSSQTTGGLSLNGEDGRDGEDGAAGQAGKDGKAGGNGQSVIGNNGQSRSSYQIESTISGVQLLDVQNTGSRAESNQSAPATDITTSSKTVLQVDLENANNEDLSGSVIESLQETISLWRLVLVKYVSELF